MNKYALACFMLAAGAMTMFAAGLPVLEGIQVSIDAVVVLLLPMLVVLYKIHKDK